MLDSAIAFAALAHAGQVRKYTGEPYVCHPIEVMQIVSSVPHTTEMLTAAVLHDVLEDTVVSQREIRRRFGEEVERLVVGLTEVPMEGNRAQRKAWERERLAGEPAEVQTIKVADLISNTRSIAKHDPKFAVTYLEEKRLLLEVMKDADAYLAMRAYAQIQCS